MKRAKWILLIVAVVVVAAAAGIAYYIYDRLNADVIELAPIDGDLAFISDRNGNWDILIAKPDETITDITAEGDGHDYLHNFTFGSDMIYFYTTRSGEFSPARVKPDGSDLEVMNFIQAATKAFSSGHMDVDPRWSPGGTQIAWTKTRGFANDVCYSAADDVNNFTCVTEKQGVNNMMSWSPDGTRLAFVSDREAKQDVFVVDLASGEQTRLSGDEGWDFQPVWSLDGQQILFISNREDDSLVQGILDMYIVSPDGGDVQPFEAGTPFKGAPTYSPSGQQVAYMSNESGTWQIYVMDADGSNVRQITEGDSNNLYPAWVPEPSEDAVTEE